MGHVIIIDQQLHLLRKLHGILLPIFAAKLSALILRKLSYIFLRRSLLRLIKESKFFEAGHTQVPASPIYVIRSPAAESNASNPLALFANLIFIARNDFAHLFPF